MISPALSTPVLLQNAALALALIASLLLAGLGCFCGGYSLGQRLASIWLHGYLLPQGWLVAIVPAHTHFIVEAFPAPDRFLPECFLGCGPGDAWMGWLAARRGREWLRDQRQHQEATA